MKKRYLIILVVLSLLCYYVFICINSLNVTATAQLLEDSDFIRNFILENEEKDSSLKTFIAVREISSIDNEDNMEFYGLVLIDTYKITEEQLLEHNQSTSKLYKLILKNGKVIGSDNINVENINLDDDYSAFPKDIITEYMQIKDSIDLTKSINTQIDNYYNEINKQNQVNTGYSFSYKVFILKKLFYLKKNWKYFAIITISCFPYFDKIFSIIFLILAISI